MINDPYEKYNNSSNTTLNQSNAMDQSILNVSSQFHNNTTTTISQMEAPACPNSPRRLSFQETDPEIVELMKRDIREVKDEIVAFMTQNKITQSGIVRATNNRISQPYVSTWIINPKARNFKKIRVLFDWYVKARRTFSEGGNNNDNNSMYAELKPNIEEMNSYPASSAVWPSVCESYLDPLLDKILTGEQLEQVRTKCSKLVQEFYYNQGHITQEQVTIIQLTEYLNKYRRPVKTELDLTCVDYTRSVVNLSDNIVNLTEEGVCSN